MQPDEEVVSDVHLFLLERDRTHQLPSRHFGRYPAYFSRFIFRNPASEEEEEEAEEEEKAAYHKSDEETYYKGPQLDDDGDLVLPRKQTICSEVVYLEHALKTRLPDVGLQVWPGCMILCDFIMDNRMTFDDKVIVEFGAGIGFPSIVASMFARRVIATDVNADVLKACSYNATLNKHLINSKCSKLSATSSSSSPPPRVEVCHFDWFSMSNEKDNFSSNKIPSGLKILSTDDTGADFVLDLDEVDVLIASDVIYSDDLTDAFFRSVYEILRTSLKCRMLVMSVEKRLNFTVKDLDIASPAYTHFRNCLAHLSDLYVETGERITIDLVTDIRQYFEYQRSNYLELWRLSVEKSDRMKSAA